MTIEVQRVYGTHPARRGRRFLVDRLWPRGVRKVDLPLDGSLKDVAPSDRLRHWFQHDPRRRELESTYDRSNGATRRVAGEWKSKGVNDPARHRGCRSTSASVDCRRPRAGASAAAARAAAPTLGWRARSIRRSIPRT